MLLSLQVNHLSTALLAILLTPNLMRAYDEHGWQPRLVLTASSMHYWATFTGPEFVDRGILAALNKPQYGTLESIQPNKYPDSKCAFPVDISSCSTAHSLWQ